MQYVVMVLVAIFFFLFFWTVGDAKADDELIWKEKSHWYDLDCTRSSNTKEFNGCGMRVTYLTGGNYGDVSFYFAKLPNDKILIQVTRPQWVLPPGPFTVKFKWANGYVTTVELDKQAGHYMGSAFNPNKQFWTNLTSSKDFRLTINGQVVGSKPYDLEGSAAAYNRMMTKFNEFKATGRAYNFNDSSGARVDTF